MFFKELSATTNDIRSLSNIKKYMHGMPVLINEFDKKI